MSMTTRALVVAASLLGLLACDSEDEPATDETTGEPPADERPSDDPQAGDPQAAEPAAGESSPSGATAGSDRVFDASAQEPTPYAVGQWTKHHFLDADGTRTTEMVYKIVGHEGDTAWWFEVELTGDQDAGVRLLLDVPNLHDPEGVEVREVIVRMPGGNLQRFSGGMLATIQSQFDRYVTSLIVDWRDIEEREDVEVPAGRFLSCLERTGSESFGPFESSGTIWHHSAVPISGMIRRHGDDGKKIVLVDFGLTGAEATMDGPAQELDINVPSGLLQRLMDQANRRGAAAGGMATMAGAEESDEDK